MAARPISKLWIAIPNYRGIVESGHHFSMMQLFHLFGTMGRNVHYISPTHTILQTARQVCVNEFLADREASHLLFIDDDMVFGPEQYMLLEHELVENDLDYLCALAFANAIPSKPCVFGLHPEYPEFGKNCWWHIVSDYPKQQRFKVYASGFGMVLMTRQLLDTMRDGKDDYQHFRVHHPSCPNEDVAFGINAQTAGMTLWCDSRVSIGHIAKERVIISEDIYEAQGKATQYALGLPRSRFLKDSSKVEFIKEAVPA